MKKWLKEHSLSLYGLLTVLLGACMLYLAKVIDLLYPNFVGMGIAVMLAGVLLQIMEVLLKKEECFGRYTSGD